ncbi:DUF1116 domain-containing protein [Microbaculum marinisediminis]|uniref:DUF1116 domain-containing protein n=1 Tax=Microbaculum marinisediminis TaxID=2931392 RepID=A0AAW5QU33_9HYPH|nr:DUF1116 domain-containing protein [Microbaculum sp. A6E488]MCT8971402.1 DUF1116 domain-containing protein [Microbaculum sp. A6E488]
MTGIDRAAANAEAFRRMTAAEPVLVDILPARDVVPGMDRRIVLTSGAPLPWEDYEGGQREGLIGGALYEGWAGTREEAIALFDSGGIAVGACQDHACVGSLAGIYTPSMPVFVVEDRATGRRAYCNMYEGKSRKRLNYGTYDETVHRQLKMVETILAPTLAETVRDIGGVPLKPLMIRALNMGDELHSRNTAASLMFARELTPGFLRLFSKLGSHVEKTVELLTEDHYFFLRLSMAAAKVSADLAHGVEGASIVTAMAFSCREFSIRVSGLDGWIRGPHASVEAKLFDGHDASEITWMGGESPITETIGLGGFAQGGAPTLQAYQGGSYAAMMARNETLYDIVEGENPDYKIAAFGYRGTPTGIDLFKVLKTGILPVMDIGIAGKGGGQIGAGVVSAPMDCFRQAAELYAARYGD